MSGRDLWIVIPNWDRFQHYKDRSPLWIKVYTELNSDPNWQSLTLPQRGLLCTIWIEYARSRCELSAKQVRSMIGRAFKVRSLEALNHAGFIQLSASRPPARIASPEKSREEKSREEPLTPQSGAVENTKPKTNPRALGTNPRAIAHQDKEQAHRELLTQAAHLATTWDGTDSAEFDEALDELEQTLQSRLSFGERDDLWEKAFHLGF